MFKNEEIEFTQLSEESIFNCSHCGQMGHEAPVRSKNKKRQLKTYHPQCAEAVIYKIKFGTPERIQSQTIKTISDSSLSLPKKSFLRPIEDEELERKKAKLKALLKDDYSALDAIDGKEKEIEKQEPKPKARIEFEEGKVLISHKYNVSLVEKYHFIKQIKFNKINKKWECLISDADYETCRFLFKVFKEVPEYDWLISEEAFKAIKNRIVFHEKNMKVSKEIKEIKAKEDIDIDLSHMKIPPFPYQKVGVYFLNKIGGVGMVGDSMGLGKSNQAIGYTSLNNLHTIIVCPASLKYNWKKEIEKFTDKKSVIITEFEPEVLQPKNKMADYVIINYDQLLKYEKYLLKAKFDCVVLDESQYIMNLQSKRTKAVFKFFKKCKHRICLSGTPIKNRPEEFYAQLKFLRPDLFSNKMKYALRYCDAKETAFGWDLSGASNLDELNRKIAPFYIRRLKSEVLKELPPKTVSVLEMDMNATERQEYTKITKDFSKLMKENWSIHGKTYADRRIDGAHLAKLVELKQYCSKIKAKRIVEFVNDFVASSENRKIIVFAQFIETQKILKEAFPGISVSLLGEDSDDKRNEAVEKFQNDPSIRVFVGSTKAAGVGLTLTAADTVCFADLMWSPADHEQAADRIHRIGQTNPVFIYYMIFKNSIESMIWNIIGEKLSIITQITDGKTIKNDHPDVVKMVFSEMLEKFKKEMETSRV